MSGTAISPGTIRWTLGFGLWTLATWGVLQLHEMPIAPEHSVCGIWGCGPTIPALLSAHGFWLMVLVPVAAWASRRLGPRRATWIGSACLIVGLGGVAALSIAEAASWPGGNHPELRSYLGRRILFVVATTVEVPLIPMTVAGLILLSGRRRGPRAGEGCDGSTCGDARSGDVASGPIGLGTRLPELSLIAPDGTAFVVPKVAGGRTSVLYFMRDSGCSICRGHARSLINRSDEFEAKGVEVVIVQPGGIERSRELSESLSSPFPVASARLTGAYQTVGLSGRGFGLLRGSGTVLIDGLGVVRFVRLASLPFSGFSEPILLEILESVLADRVGPVPIGEVPSGARGQTADAMLDFPRESDR